MQLKNNKNKNVEATETGTKKGLISFEWVLM